MCLSAKLAVTFSSFSASNWVDLLIAVSAFVAAVHYLFLAHNDYKEAKCTPADSSILVRVRAERKSALLALIPACLALLALYLDIGSQRSNEAAMRALNPLNRRVGIVSASGSLTVSGFNLMAIPLIARPLLLDFHRRGTPQNLPLLCFELDRLTTLVTNECSMIFLPMSLSCPLPSNTVGNLLASIDTCCLTFNGAPVSPNFRPTGGVITLTANDIPKRFILPPQRLATGGFITIIGVEETAGVSRVTWTNAPKMDGTWIYRLE
jgi:hypothetical protein